MKKYLVIFTILAFHSPLLASGSNSKVDKIVASNLAKINALQVKWQYKRVQSFVDGPKGMWGAAIGPFIETLESFEGLKVGQTYEVRLNATFSISEENARAAFCVQMKSMSRNCIFVKKGLYETTTESQTFLFTATESSLKIGVTLDKGVTLRGGNATLFELNNYIETNEW